MAVLLEKYKRAKKFSAGLKIRLSYGCRGRLTRGLEIFEWMQKLAILEWRAVTGRWGDPGVRGWEGRRTEEKSHRAEGLSPPLQNCDAADQAICRYNHCWTRRNASQASYVSLKLAIALVGTTVDRSHSPFRVHGRAYVEAIVESAVFGNQNTADLRGFIVIILWS